MSARMWPGAEETFLSAGGPKQSRTLASMATGSNEDNPYRSPAASGTRTEPTRGGVWPLIVPVGLLYFYGALVVLYGASFLYMLLGGCSLSD